ncbi:MAG: Omp28-related outer membrane protein [Flavobacteriales bacterium]|nr:Omp28-related outer membrane protein [Flavobacteriales bacterium]
MKKSLAVLSGLILAIGLNVSCDKVTQPHIIQTSLDTTLYPGNFIEYEFPTFTQNTNTERNVLLEDYTGHKCSFCPAAAEMAEGLEDANPGRVFVATIHAGAANNGVSDFQKTNESGMYTRDFTTTEGKEMASDFFQMGVGFNANPKGTVNRLEEAGLFFLNSPDWEGKVNEVLASELNINLQAQSSYFDETKGIFLHVETEFINNLEGEYNIVVYILQKSIVDWQLKFGEGDIPDYNHHNVHIGNMFGETWGRSVASGSISAGTKVQTDFSYQIPDGLTKDDILSLIYVYDKSNYEVMQVIEHKF